ncbi:3-deoxy-manno-octulosonate cytidylyltransferase [Acidisoma cladoniae]|jgi:3-deoxy-manno-octulosonate cytidylyltransferase (CMP-KDO synthetase)|uniref:3-deoxy-manno-octulosonate cytidylyltransferase n=1 Tax=Acidisoma cladoniae TaxID=3040935 RepID=UPI00254C8DF0|nr:3-deoxy-manno-octulosonate cytidylyltransferase [Acidisoma sp. PAMC 29798]
MNPIVIIPARMSSTRLPDKPMAMIHGQPMIVHVWRRAMETGLGRVIVATDHPAIAAAVSDVGGEVVMTRPDHPSGTDRLAEALAQVDPRGHHDVVVNFQGDLPTVSPGVTLATVALLNQSEVSLATPVAEITNMREAEAPSVVKMIGVPLGEGRFRVLYFTRAQAPWGEGPLYHHIGLYAWRREAFDAFVALPPSSLELREKLEQLRALEAGMKIHAILVKDVPLGVDTAADLERARDMLKS